MLQLFEALRFDGRICFQLSNFPEGPSVVLHATEVKSGRLVRLPKPSKDSTVVLFESPLPWVIVLPVESAMGIVGSGATDQESGAVDQFS